MNVTKEAIFVGTVLVTAMMGGVAVTFFFIGHNTGQYDECLCTRNSNVTEPASNITGKHYGRLPRTIEPLIYQIELFPDIYGNDPSLFVFDGCVTLKFRCVEETQSISMNINNLNITEGSVKVWAVGTKDEVNITGYSIDTKWQFLTVNLSVLLKKGSEYVIQMSYTGPLRTDFAGLYLSTFQFRTTNKYVAATQFSPTDARKAFPCLDEPDRKAQFDITLIRRKDCVSLSNMPRVRQIPRDNGFIADVYQRTPKMSTYLVAMAIGDLVPKTISARQGLNFTAWAGYETIEKTEVALHVGANALTFFERYFGIEFPLPKQDILGLPETAVGAMENWGLIIFNDERIFYNKTSYSFASLKNAVLTIVHEVAHQWFGNLVTMDWWSDLMLKEGFAVYFENVGTGYIFPEWNIIDEYPVNYMHGVFETDGLVSSHPVYKELSDTTQIRQVFDAISYEKGGCMIRMLNFILGESSFQEGLKHYLNKHMYDSVGHTDLWITLESKRRYMYSGAALPSIKEIMETWVLQKNYPVVTITQVKPGKLLIKQERFLNNGLGSTSSDSDSPFKYIWQIPLTLTNCLSPRFNHNYTDILWMGSRELYVLDANMPDFHLPGNWIVANINQWGYYRVNYDLPIWKTLIEQFKIRHDVIDAVSRAQIINDLFSLGKAKMVNFSLALESLQYLQNETEYVPWTAALREIAFMGNLLKFDQIYSSFKGQVLRLIKKIFNDHRSNFANLTMSQMQTYVQLYSIACQYGMTECIEESDRLYNDWKTGEASNVLEPNLRSTIVCTIVEHGNKSDWNFIFNKYTKALNVNEKRAYLNGLTCTTDAVLHTRLINLTMDSNSIQARDVIRALTGLARNKHAMKTAWQHVTNKWNKFMNDYAGSLFLLDSLVQGITGPFSTRDQLVDVETFINKTVDLGPAEQAFNQAKEAIQTNIAWLSSHYTELERWVKIPISVQ